MGKAPKTLASYYVGELVDADHDASDAASDADETSSTSSASASTSTSASEELPSHVAAFR